MAKKSIPESTATATKTKTKTLAKTPVPELRSTGKSAEKMPGKKASKEKAAVPTPPPKRKARKAG